MSQHHYCAGLAGVEVEAMSGPKLVIVPEVVPPYELGRAPETTHERVARLQHEAKLLAREEIEALDRELAKVAELAASIAAGGDAYPAGVRDLAERTAADLRSRVQTLQALMERTAL